MRRVAKINKKQNTDIGDGKKLCKKFNLQSIPIEEQINFLKAFLLCVYSIDSFTNCIILGSAEFYFIYRCSIKSKIASHVLSTHNSLMENFSRKSFEQSSSVYVTAANRRKIRNSLNWIRENYKWMFRHSRPDFFMITLAFPIQSVNNW